jgi:hypothetical protein
MTKIVLALAVALALASCNKSQQQLGLKEALIAKLKDDQDLKDYKLEPEEVADCVIAQITDSVPGIPGDPRRDRYYEAYTKFMSVQAPSDAQKTIESYQDLFGSVHDARQAAMSITDFIMECMGGAIERRGDDGK